MKEMSQSVFTIEADSKPVLSFAAKRYQDAEVFCGDEQVRTKLRSLHSGGAPLCDDTSILRVRLAHPHERAKYHERTPERSAEADLNAVYLVKLDAP